MKSIKAIKDGKYSTVGQIDRVKDKEADQKVSTGYWDYINKTEWKQSTRKSKEETVTEDTKSKESKKVTNKKKQSDKK